MDMYRYGQQHALVKLGVARPRKLDSADETALLSDYSTPDDKQQYYRNYLQDVAQHQVAPMEDYVRDTRAGYSGGGAMLGGLMGGLTGAGMASGSPMRGGLIGALGGAALGGLGGYALGGPSGRAAHREDTTRNMTADYLINNDPAMRDAYLREISGREQRRRQAAIEDQRRQEALTRAQYMAAANHMANKFAPRDRRD